MGGMMRRLFALLGLMLVTVACCNGKKLWGVDVGKKEENGEFESLLAQASGKDSATQGDVGPALAALKDIDMSELNLSQLCTYLLDLAIEVVEDSSWQEQFADPGVIRGILDNSGVDSLMGDDSLIGPEKDDLMALLALESNPTLYRTKFDELVLKTVAKLRKLRKDVADPVKLKTMIKDTLKSAGLDRETINQVMELVDNPQMMAAQLQALLDDPAVVAELNKAVQAFTQADSMLSDGGFDEDELMMMLSALDENPEMVEEMYAELLKDPEMAEVMKAAGLGEVGGVPATGAGGGGGGIFGRGRGVEL